MSSGHFLCLFMDDVSHLHETVRVKGTSFSLDKTFTEFFIESYTADDLRFDSSWIKRYIATLVFMNAL